jgi:hypothetical protein
VDLVRLGVTPADVGFRELGWHGYRAGHDIASSQASAQRAAGSV